MGSNVYVHVYSLIDKYDSSRLNAHIILSITMKFEWNEFIHWNGCDFENYHSEYPEIHKNVYIELSLIDFSLKSILIQVNWGAYC